MGLDAEFEITKLQTRLEAKLFSRALKRTMAPMMHPHLPVSGLNFSDVNMVIYKHCHFGDEMQHEHADQSGVTVFKASNGEVKVIDSIALGITDPWCFPAVLKSVEPVVMTWRR